MKGNTPETSELIVWHFMNIVIHSISPTLTFKCHASPEMFSSTDMFYLNLELVLTNWQPKCSSDTINLNILPIVEK